MAISNYNFKIKKKPFVNFPNPIAFAFFFCGKSYVSFRLQFAHFRTTFVFPSGNVVMKKLAKSMEDLGVLKF